MTEIALLNAPVELTVARSLVAMALDRLHAQEEVLKTKRLDHEAYLERFGRADELRQLAEEMINFVDSKERNA